MFLTQEMWSGLSAVEKVSLSEWLKEHDIKNVYIGRVRPSTRFNGNTITVDTEVWNSINPHEWFGEKEIDVELGFLPGHGQVFDKCIKKLSAQYPCLLEKSCTPLTGGGYEHRQCMNEELGSLLP